MTPFIDATGATGATGATDAVVPAPLVRIDHVSRCFGDTVALDDVSLDIHENEFFALLGPSGCGKTTLLRILAGLDEPDSGTVTLDGADLVAMPAYRRPINLMFQSYALFPHLSVAKNVAYGLQRDKVPKDEIRMRVQEALTTVGLVGMDDRRPTQLSGGQRQRVALARAMVKRPRLLLLDEPLAALDRKIRSQMQSELKRLQHEVGITFVVVTHDQEEAMSMADRIAVLDQGHVEQIAAPAELYERPATRFVADFIGSTNLFDGIVASDGAGVELSSGRVLETAVAGRAPGSVVSVSVRPEQVVVGVRTGEGSGHAVVTGTVRDVNFYGGLSHAMVEVEGFDALLVVSTTGPAPHRPGDQVSLSWPSSACVVVDR